jgi:hypothetical protein
MSDIFDTWNHFEKELRGILDDYNIVQLGASAAKYLALRREENKALLEACLRHKRELDLLAGEKVEPVAHEASATLVASLGGSGG